MEVTVTIQEMWSQRQDGRLLGERWEDGDMVGTRDGRKSTDHTPCHAIISQPTEIPGDRGGIRWG